MTLLTIAKAACYEIGILPPGTIVNNSAPDALKLLRYASKVGSRLMKAANWQVLRKEKTFTGIAGSTQTSILPTDFDRFVPETFWNRTSRLLVSGPISAVQWQGLQAGGYSGNPKFIYRGGSVSILPVLSGGESLAFEYISTQWCQSSGAVAQTGWMADTDTGILDEELIALGVMYEHLSGEGLPNQAAANAYQERFDMLLKSDQPDSGVMVAGDIFGGGRHFDGTPSTSFSILNG